MTSEGSREFLRSVRVLVVDDESSVRRVVRQILERAGWKVAEAGTSAEAEAVVGGSDEQIDLLVLDLMLQGEEAGLVLARKLLKLRPGLPILFMSGYADLEARLEEMPEVPTDFIGKPMSLTDLVRKANGLVSRPPPDMSDVG